jgi:hypothetical protein
MEHKLKALAAATDSPNLKKLIESHVKELKLENNHLVIYVENAAQVHELEEPRMGKHLKSALEKIFDPSITYEVRLGHTHDKPDHVEFEKHNKSR